MMMSLIKTLLKIHHCYVTRATGNYWAIDPKRFHEVSSKASVYVKGSLGTLASESTVRSGKLQFKRSDFLEGCSR